MANQAEIDYEKQFQEDLAKATALSLEQEALDEYNRAKKYGSAFTQNAQQEAKNKLYAQIRRQHYARTASGGTENSSLSYATPSSTPQHALALPTNLQQSQRRHSEVTNHNASSLASFPTDSERSKTPPALSSGMAENDLINFASPTAKNSEQNSFEKLIEDLQKLQTTNPQTALVPLGPTAAAPMYPSSSYNHHGAAAAAGAAMYAGSAAAVQPPGHYGITTPAGAAGMQLVPFIPSSPQQKVPLTQDELAKLYNMTPQPHSASIYGPRPAMGFIPPRGAPGYYTPPTPPVMAGSSAPPYSAPMHYPNAYGYQFQATSTPGAQPYFPSNMSAAAASNASISSSNPSLNASAHHHHLQQTVLSSSNNSFNYQKHSSTISINAGGGVTSGSTTSLPGTSQSNGMSARRQTPPARKMSSRVPGSDLIDLSHEDDSRVSVLEAFDPLLNENESVTKRLTKN